MTSVPEGRTGFDFEMTKLRRRHITWERALTIAAKVNILELRVHPKGTHCGGGFQISYTFFTCLE